MTEQEKQTILDEVGHHKLDDGKIYAWIEDGKVIFSNFDPPRSLVKEFAVVRYGKIEQVITYKEGVLIYW